MSVGQRARTVLLPFAATFAGIGGIAFHAGHGPEHLLCIVVAVGVAVAGAFWGVYNRFFRSPSGHHITERCDKEAGHDT